MERSYDVTVVIPVYNEDENIEGLYNELKAELVDNGYKYEIIFIDDGSTDKTLTKIKVLCEDDSRIKVVSFTKNFGQTAALACGFDLAKGNIVVPMDGDGQNYPGDIPKLLKKIKEGYDVVSGWRKNRKDPFFTRRLPSTLANKIIAWVTGVKIHDYGCTLKAYKKDVIKDIPLYGEMHRFIPAIANWKGVKIAEIEVKHRKRERGKSKYGLIRTFKVILDLFTVKFLGSWSTKPIYIFGGLGLLCYVFASMSGFYMLYQKFYDALSFVQNPMLLLSAMMTILGTQCILMGLLAEICVRIYHDSKKKPIYYIKNVLENQDKNK